MESAANCRPAIQPSVRLSSAAMSSAERFSPIIWLRNSAASAGEAQIGSTQFGELIAHPQARQRQERVFTAGNDQTQLRRLVFDKKCQG